MKRIIIVASALSLLAGSAFAQGTTGPQAQQDNMTKPGMTTGTSKKSSKKTGSMKSGASMKKDPNATPNPDATSQGTVGPGTNSGTK